MKKITLTKEISCILAIKLALLFLLWFLFFNPQTKTHVDEKVMAGVLILNTTSNEKVKE